ncbi:RNA-directed DNA polymerase, eukaryota, reverse transcriptase zinc-binding domain protein [Tanacetum coccineum]
MSFLPWSSNHCIQAEYVPRVTDRPHRTINNTKINKKTASKKYDVSKKNSKVCENGTEKDKEFNGSEGSDRDDCVGTNDEREMSDERSKGMLKDNAGINGTSDSETECNSNVEQVENIPNIENAVNKTYANIVKHDDLPKNLNYIPTLITDSGNEVVIFDEDLVSKGSERWNLTLCGQFVGYVMNIHEIRYNIRRMCGKFGISEIDAHKNGQYVLKFRDSAGLNAVLEKGP